MATASRWASGGETKRRGREVLVGRPQRAPTARRRNILIACIDGLAGFPEANEAMFPQTWVKTCIVTMPMSA